MDTELKDYEEPEDNISTLAINGNAHISTSQSFPEMWEIEMEVLQVENTLNKIVHVAKCPIIPPVECLEDYVDTDEEQEKEDKSDKHRISGTQNEETFPAMWELELEVLNCDQYSSEESSKELENADILEFEMLEVFSSHDISSTSTNSASIKHNTTPSYGEIHQATFMLEDLNISYPEEMQLYLNDDNQKVLSNLNIS